MRICNPVQYNRYVETDYTSEGGKKYKMHTKDTAGKTAPSVARAKQAQAPETAGEPEPEEPVPPPPLGGLGDDSLEGLGAAFSGPSVGGPEGKEEEKKKESVDMGIGEENPGDGHEPSDEIPLDNRPVESAPSASYHPAVPSPTTSTLQATHPATSSPITTPHMAERLGFTGMPYSTYGLTPAATAPFMVTAVSNQWHPAPSTPVFMCLCHNATMMTITDLLRVYT